MEIYKNIEDNKNKEFEKLLVDNFSKTKIEEGKILTGTITKITEKIQASDKKLTKQRALQRAFISMIYNTNDTADIPLAATNGANGILQSNRIIWANGGEWPAQHLPQNRGFSTVVWLTGECKAIAHPTRPSILWVFILPLGVILFNGKISPLRRAFNYFPFASSLVRLSPDFLSKWVGSVPAFAIGFDKDQASTYTMPSLVALFSYWCFFF